MKIVIATGGTQGHIFPALEVKKCLQAKGHEVIMHSLDNAKVQHDEVTEKFFKSVRPKGLDLSSFNKGFSSVFVNLAAVVNARKVLKELSPQVVCGFGSYSAFPVVFGAVTLGIPTLIHEQNVVPGKANLLLSKFVKKTAVSFRETEKYFKKGNTVFTGCPCRVRKSDLDKELFYSKFSFSKDNFTILVFGGSQGSKKINGVFLKSLELMKDKKNIQVIHITGKEDYHDIKDYYYSQDIKVAVYDFFDEIDKAYIISDLVICRAGALTVIELSAVNVPSLLIPYPHAKGHQKYNAEILCKLGIASMIEEKDLTPEKLKEEALRRLKFSGQKSFFGKGHGQVYIPDAAEKISMQVIGLINEN